MRLKLLFTLLIAGCSHVAHAAPQTFDEAFQSLSEKVRNRDATALKEADQVLALAQTDEQKARVFPRIGDARLTQSKPALARQQYEKALKLPGLSLDLQNTALVMLATTYEFQQPADYEKARATFRRIVDNKDFSEENRMSARLKIASNYDQAGDSATARAQLKNIAGDEKNELWGRASALMILAEMELRQRNYLAARENYQKLRSLSPDDTTIKMMALDGTRWHRAELLWREEIWASAPGIRQNFEARHRKIG